MLIDYCDKCGRKFEPSQGKVKMINDLSKCYICGNFEPVPIINEEEQISSGDVSRDTFK